MRILRDYQFIEAADRGATAAIGNFDGVHQGHLSVIELARAALPDAPFEYQTLEKIARTRQFGVWGTPVDRVITRP